MKNKQTGDQSGGLHYRDGSSTPTHTVGHNTGEKSSDEVAESTVDKNAPNAFRQQPNTPHDLGERRDDLQPEQVSGESQGS